MADLSENFGTLSDALVGQEIARRYELANVAVGVGVASGGAVIAAAWGGSKLVGRLAERWPGMRGLSDQLEAIYRGVAPGWEAMAAALEGISLDLRLVSKFDDVWRAAMPPNLREIQDLNLSRVVEVVADGIPLYLIPRQATAEALLAAETPQARRAILRSHAGTITSDCRMAWAEHRTALTQEWISLLESGVRAYEAGHIEPAQAIFTVVLDTITFALPQMDRKRLTKRPFGSTDFEEVFSEEGISTALAVLPLWSIHEANWAGQAHPIPHSLNRHASLHRASSRQYSKRNAIQALMLATSLLVWYAQHDEQPS